MARELFQALRAPGAEKPNPLARAAWAKFLRAAGRRDEAERIEAADPIVQRLANPIVTRADQTIGATANHAALAQAGVADYFSNLPSAGARLIAQATSIPLESRSSISFPRSSSTPVAAEWVAEGEPIPVGGGTLSHDTLGPQKKFASIVAFSAELAKRSGGQAIFETILKEKAAAALDAALFSDTAGSASAHAGLRYGLTPLSTSGYPDGDVEKVAAAVADAGGSTVVIVAAPSQAMAIRVRFPLQPFEVLASTALPAGTLLGLDPAALAVSFGSVDIYPTTEALLHMSDDPLEIVDAAGTISDPARSLWQTNSVALRLIVDVAFAMRGGRIAAVAGTWP